MIFSYILKNRYNFGKIRITGANRHITELIGKPIPIKINSDKEKKHLTTQQELFIYLKRDLGKLRLQKTTILGKKKPIEKLLEEGEKEIVEINHQIDHLSSKVTQLKKELIDKTQKADEIKEKIALHTKGKSGII